MAVGVGNVRDAIAPIAIGSVTDNDRTGTNCPFKTGFEIRNP